MSVPRHRMTQGQGQEPEFHLQEFSGGMHLFSAREAIADNEQWWCENVIPLTKGNLSNVQDRSGAVATFTDTGAVNYAMGFNVGGLPFAFVVFGGTGTGWVVDLTGFTATKIIASGLTNTYATQYSNLGILIIDPSGYFDYGVTTPATLTTWNNSITGGTLVSATTVAMGTSLTNTGLAPGTGGVIQAQYIVKSVSVNAGGTNYVVGDVLTDNSGSTPWLGIATNRSQIVVTSIGAGGAITGISFVNPGIYQGPSTGNSLATGPVGAGPYTGGSGTGATFFGQVQATGIFLVSAPGTGYTAGTSTQDKNGATVITTYKITTSGIIGGTSIATYAGRVWIGNNRTVFVTDVNSYNFFGGAGTSFTINDAYLFNKITALFSANNYLYIFGPTSVDALSNVTVSATTGLTSFTRINIVQGVGTISPASVFAYYRAVCFFDPSGFYLLTGATPEKISEKISTLVQNVSLQSAVTNSVYGGVVSIQGELCAFFSFVVTDLYSGGAQVARSVNAMFFRRRWWVHTLNTGSSLTTVPGTISVVYTNNKYVMFQIGNASGGSTQSVWRAFAAAGNAAWVLRTRLWDGNAILREKQALNAAIAVDDLASGSVSGITFTVDNELGSSASQAVPMPSGATFAYRLLVDQAQQGGGQYLGLTFNGNGVNSKQIHLAALRGKQDRDFMQ